MVRRLHQVVHMAHLQVWVLHQRHPKLSTTAGNLYLDSSQSPPATRMDRLLVEEQPQALLVTSTGHHLHLQADHSEGHLVTNTGPLHLLVVRLVYHLAMTMDHHHLLEEDIDRGRRAHLTVLLPVVHMVHRILEDHHHQVVHMDYQRVEDQ